MSVPGVIAIGTESSGTRLLAKVLIAGGARGGAAHQQEFDSGLPLASDPIVWRRSVPHDNEEVDVEPLVSRLRSRGYEPIVVVIVRDWTATERSQARRRAFVPNVATARRRMRAALVSIFEQIGALDLDYHVVTYEEFVLHPEGAQAALWSRLGLPGGDPVAIRDENDKYLASLREEVLA